MSTAFPQPALGSAPSGGPMIVPAERHRKVLGIREVSFVARKQTLATVDAFGALCLSADTNKGQEAFEKQCSGCHSLDTAKDGPPLRGVFGRRAGKVEGFRYSDDLKSSQFTWDETSLDK